LLDLGDEAFLGGLDLGELLTQRGGLPVPLGGYLGGPGGELDFEHGGVVVAEEVLVGEPGRGGGDALVAESQESPPGSPPA
jgi:hypothetical protein